MTVKHNITVKVFEQVTGPSSLPLGEGDGCVIGYS